MINNGCGFNCPVEATIQLIGGKYKAVILWHLMNKTLRYNEIHKLIPKATDKMLAQQLRELEKDGLINRKVYPVVPPKTEYSLTEFGKTLTPFWMNYVIGENNICFKNKCCFSNVKILQNLYENFAEQLVLSTL